MCEEKGRGKGRERKIEEKRTAREINMEREGKGRKGTGEWKEKTRINTLMNIERKVKGKDKYRGR